MIKTSYATGLLAFVLLTSAVLTVPVAELLLWLYRRSVHRGMTSAAKDPGTPDRSIITGTARPAIQILGHKDAGGDGPSRFRDAEQSLRRAVAVYALAGFAFALSFALGWTLQTPEGLHAWQRILWLTGCYSWPTVLAIELVAATSR